MKGQSLKMKFVMGDTNVDEFPKCPNPCKMITYKDSQLELREPTYQTEQSLANFEMVMNSIRKIKKQALVYSRAKPEIYCYDRVD